MGTDCKSAGDAYAGSNPARPNQTLKAAGNASSNTKWHGRQIEGREKKKNSDVFNDSLSYRD